MILPSGCAGACGLARSFLVFTDLLLGLAWVAIVLLPAIVASREPIESHNGYLDNYMNPDGDAHPGTGQTDSEESVEASQPARADL